MKNLFQTNIIPVRTLSEIFQDTPQDGMPMATESQGQTMLSPRIIGGIAEGMEFRSQDSGARVEILPIADPTIGMRVYDDADTEVFKTLVSGADVGDVIMGDYANNKYAMWDKSASSFIIKGVAITDPIITGIGAGSEIAIQNWSHNMAFSATDHDTVAWASGSIKLLDGTIFSIDAGNTSTMSSITYIYFSKADSETVLQTTTTYSTALGSNKILVAVAQNVASGKKAIFQVLGGKALGGAGKLWTADDIAANAVTANLVGANEIIANTANISNGVITNAKISDLAVSKLTAGAITSKIVELAFVDTEGDVAIRCGKTDFGDDSTSGFIWGIDDSVAGNPVKLEMGSSATKLFKYDGTDLTMVGAVITAGTVQTASSGKRIVLGSASHDVLLYNASNNAILDIGSQSTRIMGIIPHSDVQGLYLASSFELTSELMRLTLLNALSDAAIIGITHSGLGYALFAAAISNASRVKPTGYFVAQPGQGAHIGMNVIATAPQTPTEGELYANTDHLLYYYDGTAQRALATQQYVDDSVEPTETFTVGESIDSEEAVYVKSSDEKVYLADANEFMEARLNFVGFATESKASGEIAIQMQGIKDGFFLDLTPASSEYDQQHLSYNGAEKKIIDNVGDAYSQGFRSGDKAGNVDAVILKLSKFGSPNYNIVVAIRAMDSYGKPTGEDLASATKDMTTVSTSVTDYTFNFDPPASTIPGELYTIVIYVLGGGPTLDGSNYINVFASQANHGNYFIPESPTYIFWTSNNGGTLWPTSSGDSMYFRTHYSQKRHSCGDSVYLSGTPGAISLDYLSSYPFVVGRIISSTQIEVNSELKERFLGKTTTVSILAAEADREMSIGVPPRTRKVIIKATQTLYDTQEDLILTKEKDYSHVREDIGTFASAIFQWTGNRIKITGTVDSAINAVLYFYT